MSRLFIKSLCVEKRSFLINLYGYRRCIRILVSLLQVKNDSNFRLIRQAFDFNSEEIVQAFPNISEHVLDVTV